MSYKDPNKEREFQRKWCAARRKLRMEGMSCKECATKKDLLFVAKKPGGVLSTNMSSLSDKTFKKKMKERIILCKLCYRNRLIELNHISKSMRIARAKKRLQALTWAKNIV